MKYRLNDICEFINGGAWSDKEYADDGVPVLKVSNIKRNGFSLEELNYIPFDLLNKYEKHLLRVGDVVIATVGSHPNLVESAAGRSCIITQQVEGFLLNQNAVCIRSKNKDILSQIYLGLLCKTRDFQHYIQMRGKGAANQMRIAISAIKEYECDIPDLTTQNQIGDSLFSYDLLIENNQKQIKLLEESAQRLYKEWFVDFRFPGYETTSIVDGVPEGWTRCSILDNDIFVFTKSKVAPFEGWKVYYATADVTGTEISGDGEWITFQNKPSRAAIQPINESVWFARMSNSYKILCCYGESSYLSETAIISSGFAGFTAFKGCYCFVYATIASKRFNEEKNRYATGATQVSLTNEGLKKIQVVLPTKDVAEEYSRIVEPYIEKAEQLKRSIKLLRQARDRLLPKLMSGEIEV